MAGRYVAFLRGINVGGRRVSGKDLAAAFEATDGIDAAESFIASGNVVFEDSTRRKPPAIAKAIEAGLADAFGWHSTAFLRTAVEVGELADLQPFTDEQLRRSAGKAQITFYADPPSAAVAREVLALATDDDPLVIEGRELHWLPLGRMTDSELDLAAIEKILGQGTTRTANTIRRLQAKYFQ